MNSDKDYDAVEIPLILNNDIGVKMGEELSKPSSRLLLRKSKKTGQWDSYYLLISNQNNRQNIDITYNHVFDDFPNQIVVFDKDNQLVSSYNLSIPEIELSKIQNAPKECIYIGWWYSDGSFEPVMLLGCSGGGSDGGGPTYGGGNGGGGHGGGGGSSGNNSGLTMPPPPEIPIADIKKFLSCFNINQPANLSVYSQNVFSSFPGHAFISISQGGNTMTFGFYPKNGFPGYLNGPSVFGNDSGHPYSYGWNAGQISAAQLQQIIGQIVAFSNSDYGLQNNNCSDFVNYVLQIKGLNTNANGVDTPNSIGKLIAPYAQNTNGNAPQTQRTCP